MKSIEARNVMKNNAHSRWSARSKEANSDPLYAVNRVYNGYLDINHIPSFKIGKDDKIFTMGSCFAREVEEALGRRGMDVVTLTDAFDDEKLFPIADSVLRQRAFLNRYNTASILSEFLNIVGDDKDIVRGKGLYEVASDTYVDLHYSTVYHPSSFETCIERRRRALSVHQKACDCDIFIFTLGLTEVWKDELDNSFLNVTPGPRVMKKFGDQLSINTIGFVENLKNLERLYEVLSRIKGDSFKLIVTVSPVPLEVTFSEYDVILSNCRSKSTLRAVAEEFSRNYHNVEYFPSYEIVTMSDPLNAWAWDGRHVKIDMVTHIMDTFLSYYL